MLWYTRKESGNPRDLVILLVTAPWGRRKIG